MSETINRAYYNDWNHQIVIANNRGTDPSRAYIGMDLLDPDPDFAANDVRSTRITNESFVNYLGFD